MSPAPLQIFVFVATSAGAGLLVACTLPALFGQRCNRTYVVYGVGMFFLGIGLHSLIALPVVFLSHGVSALLPFASRGSLHYRPWELVYYAFAAGIGQETAKAAPIWLEQKRTHGESLPPPFFWLGVSVGFGFSLGEILFLGVNAWQPHASGVPSSALALGVLERFSATLFHLATAGLIAFGLERGKARVLLPLCVVLHSSLDGFAGLSSLSPVLPVLAEELVVLGFSLALLIAALWIARPPGPVETRRP